MVLVFIIIHGPDKFNNSNSRQQSIILNPIAALGHAFINKMPPGEWSFF